jgi:hypothetical protein
LPDADDNPPFVIQDMDLLSSLTFELSHSENPTPNCFKVGRQMALARQSRSIPTDQAEFVIRHSGPSPRRPPAAKHSEATKVPPLADYLAFGSHLARIGSSRVAAATPDCDQPAAAFATVFCDFRSKNRAWLTALTEIRTEGAW